LNFGLNSMKYTLTIICLAFLTTMAGAQKTPVKKTVKHSVVVSKKKTVQKSASDAEEVNAAKLRKQPISKQKAPATLYLKDTTQ
jgi:hypothetical protein